MVNNKEYFSSRLDTFLSPKSELENALLANKVERQKEERRKKILNAYNENNKDLIIF